MEDNTELLKEKAKLRKAEEELVRKIIALNVDENRSLQEVNKLSKERIRLGRQIRDINLQIQKNQRSAYVEAQNDINSMSGLYSKLQKTEMERIDKMMKAGSLSDIAVERGNQLATINQKIAQLTADQSLEREILQDQFDKELEKFAKQKNISSEIVDNIKNQNELAKDYASLTEGQKEQLEAQLEAYNGIKKTIGGILDTASLLVSGPTAAFGMALVGAGFVAESLGENIRKFGGFIDTAQISALGLGFVFEGAEDTLKSLSSQFGGMKDISFATQLNTNLMATNMGISGEEAANVVGSFARLNGMSMETAMDMAATTKSMAKAAGVPVDQVMRDVANSTEAFALYGKEGGANIAQAGIYAAKLGVSMDTLTGMADNLLDFESSINSELELGAMLGKNINFNRARALAFEGQIGAAVKEQLNQLGGIEAFNKMDPIAKKKAAEALGVSVAELQKMAVNMDKLNDDGTIQLTQFEQWYEALTAFATGPLGSVLKGLGGAVVAGAQLGGSFAQMGVDVKGIASKIPIIGKMFGGGGGGTGVTANQNAGLDNPINRRTPSTMKSMASGLSAFANPKVILGLAAITASIIGIGYALKIAAPGISALGEAIGSVVRSVGDAVSTIIGGLGDFFMKITSIATPEMALAIMGLAGSFVALSASLTTFAFAGVAAIPAMTAVGLFAATGGASLLGIGGEGGAETTDRTGELIDEIKGLRSDLNSGKIAVYVDGRKVTSSVSRVVDKVSTNSYGL